jgi:hypothetical protein
MKKKKKIKKEHGQKTGVTQKSAEPPKKNNYLDPIDLSQVTDFYGIIQKDLIYQAQILTDYMILTSFLLLPMKKITATLEALSKKPFTIKEFLTYLYSKPIESEEYTKNLLKEIQETEFLEKAPHIENPADKEEIRRFLKHCEYLITINIYLGNIREPISEDLVESLIRIKRYNTLISYHAGLIDGCWTEKMKESARNTKNVSSKSKKKNEIYLMVRDYFDNRSEKDDIKNHIPILMEKTNRGERTIMNMLKEINKTKD